MLPLSENDQRSLLRLARQSLEEAVRYGRRPEFDVADGPLTEPAGAFVTLRKAGALRGCIGHIEARLPLYQTVCECAVAAGLHDPRFSPVIPEELPDLLVEVSVLSPLFDIAPEQIQVGRHGLLISQGAERGLLLPQVAVEWNWNREQFLEATCQKARLPRDAWRRGARLQAFTTQVFDEVTLGGATRCSAPPTAVP
jgi:AmmeMemoRadiSam system protein A